MKKITTIILTVLFACSLLLTSCVQVNADINYYDNQIKNVILFIGDGMGQEHVSAASSYINRPLSFQNYTNYGTVNTLSKYGITDSAAAATAMATGYKVSNGDVSKYNGTNLTTILEIAKIMGKKTAVVTTDKLSGATPACFSAHASDRGDTADIINSQIMSDIDLFIGEGTSTYSAYSDAIISQGYSYVTNEADLSLSSEKIFAPLSEIEPMQTATTSSALLENLVDFALDYLECDEGFVLIIEEADIDKKSHDGNFINMLYEVLALESAVSAVNEWLQLREQDTFVCVTADHETGGLTYDACGENITSQYSFTKSGHTSKPVPYYTSGYNISASYIDNTNIFDICNFLVSKQKPL